MATFGGWRYLSIITTHTHTHTEARHSSPILWLAQSHDSFWHLLTCFAIIFYLFI